MWPTAGLPLKMKTMTAALNGCYDTTKKTCPRADAFGESPVTSIESSIKTSLAKMIDEGRNGTQFGLPADPLENKNIAAAQNGSCYSTNKPCPSANTHGDSLELPIWSCPQKSLAIKIDEGRNGARFGLPGDP